MKKIKNIDIVILLFSLLVFSLGVGWIYSKSIPEKAIQSEIAQIPVQKTSEEQKITENEEYLKSEKSALKTTVKASPKTPEPPEEIIYKTSDIPTEEKLFNVEEMMEYIKEWSDESGVPKIITFLKETCPKDNIIEMVKGITEEYAQELTRENKIKIILSLAQFYKADKTIQEKLFEILAQDKTIEQGDIPLIFVAAKVKEIDVIPDMVDWYKTKEKRRPDLEKRTFEYAAKHDYAKVLKSLQEKLPIIDAAYATKLLWILVQANAGIKSIAFLVNLGADVNYYDPKTKYTLLIQAIKNKNSQVVKELVKLGADVKKASEDKATGYPVQVARELGLTDIEMFLRGKGAKD